RICVATLDVVDRHGETRQFGTGSGHRLTKIGRKCGNAALARHIISDKSNPFERCERSVVLGFHGGSFPRLLCPFPILARAFTSGSSGSRSLDNARRKRRPKHGGDNLLHLLAANASVSEIFSGLQNQAVLSPKRIPVASAAGVAACGGDALVPACP